MAEVSKRKYRVGGLTVTRAVLLEASWIDSDYVIDSKRQTDDDHVEGMRRALKHILKHAEPRLETLSESEQKCE